MTTSTGASGGWNVVASASTASMPFHLDHLAQDDELKRIVAHAASQLLGTPVRVAYRAASGEAESEGEEGEAESEAEAATMMV